MKRVTGIVGVYFKSKDPKRLGECYRTHLGINVEDWRGAVFRRPDESNPQGNGTAVWNPFQADTSYFPPALRVS